ncbi:MAG TPA: hypothetical protein VL284_10045 [Thermoanaerobaculia bacterium]|nr:hypothetical protein [Thermoanaerobaculia bacterium]
MDAVRGVARTFGFEGGHTCAQLRDLGAEMRQIVAYRFARELLQLVLQAFHLVGGELVETLDGRAKDVAEKLLEVVCHGRKIEQLKCHAPS